MRMLIERAKDVGQVVAAERRRSDGLTHARIDAGRWVHSPERRDSRSLLLRRERVCGAVFSTDMTEPTLNRLDVGLFVGFKLRKRTI
jgi:hypothetical protein